MKLNEWQTNNMFQKLITFKIYGRKISKLPSSTLDCCKVLSVFVNLEPNVFPHKDQYSVMYYLRLQAQQSFGYHFHLTTQLIFAKPFYSFATGKIF